MGRAKPFCGVLPLLALVLVAGCQKKEEPSAAQVMRRDITGYVWMQGEVVVPPNAQAQVLPTYRAPVEQVMVEVGSNVNKGDVIIQMSFPNAEAAYEQARLNVQQAEQSLKTAQEQYNDDLVAAQQRLKEAREAEKLARQMAQEGATADVEAAAAERMAAEEAVKNEQAALKARLVVYQQQLDDAQDYLREAQGGAKLASIRAPISGTVIALNVQSGQVIGDDASEPLATIVDLDQIEVHAVVPPEGSEFVKEDVDAVLRFKGIANKDFEGTVVRVTTKPTEDGEAQYVAVFSFRNEDGLVKPGVELDTAGVKTGVVNDVLAVPADAVSKDDTGKPVVKVLQGEKWMPTVVEIGLSDGAYTEIKSGLNEGDTVQVPFS